MKLLYVSAGHPLQEADDCLMWDKLGIQWFSTGYYANTNKPGDLPYINMDNGRELWSNLFHKCFGDTHGCDTEGTLCGTKNKTWTGQTTRNLWRFTREFALQFDAVIFNFFADNVLNNKRVFAGKKIYLKTYSMHDASQEHVMYKLRRGGVRLIRNSPKEHLRSRFYAGHDYIIRGSVVKDEQEISGWNGNIKKICTFSSYLLRESDRKVDETRRLSYLKIKEESKFPFEVFGIGNNFVTHNQKLDILRNYRVNLVTGTPGANNTYSFVEAWIMGQPMVVFGPSLWVSNSYEANELITHGVDGFIGNTPEECVEYINLLMNDDELAHTVSKNARAKALTIYGRETLSKLWIEAFKKDRLL